MHALAFAPASVGNVAVGFDVLGYSASVRRRSRARRAHACAGASGLPRSPAWSRICPLGGRAEHGRDGGGRHGRGARPGFRVRADDRERHPARVGARRVGGVRRGGRRRGQRAARRPARQPAPAQVRDAGEMVASGTAHIDNIAPSLYGGLVLCGRDRQSAHQADSGAVDRALRARAAAPRSSRRAAPGRFSAAPSRSPTSSGSRPTSPDSSPAASPRDLPLIAASLEDVLIEPQRKGLIQGFQAVKNAAMSRGALGCSISGAGPTMFAWAEEVKADEVRAGDGGGVSRGGHHERRVDHADRAGRRDDRRVDR